MYLDPKTGKKLSKVEVVQRRKDIATDILFQLDNKRYTAASTYLSFRLGRLGFDGGSMKKLFDNWGEYEDEHKVKECYVCQRGAMAVSMIGLGYDGSPEEADKNADDGWMSILKGLYPEEQINVVEQFFEEGLSGYVYKALGVSPGYQVKDKEDRMRFICNRMLQTRDGLFRLRANEIKKVRPAPNRQVYQPRLEKLIAQ